MPPSITITMPDWVSYDEAAHEGEIDTHRAYPHWFRLFREHLGAPADLEGEPDAYWTEMAHLCCRLEMHRLCNLFYGRMANVLRFRDPADGEGRRRYCQKDMAAAEAEGGMRAGSAEGKYGSTGCPHSKRGRDPLYAAKGLEAREAYRKIMGQGAAEAAGMR